MKWILLKHKWHWTQVEEEEDAVAEEESPKDEKACVVRLLNNAIAMPCYLHGVAHVHLLDNAFEKLSYLHGVYSTVLREIGRIELS
jgi:hypothetical protein